MGIHAKKKKRHWNGEHALLAQTDDENARTRERSSDRANHFFLFTSATSSHPRSSNSCMKRRERRKKETSIPFRVVSEKRTRREAEDEDGRRAAKNRNNRVPKNLHPLRSKKQETGRPETVDSPSPARDRIRNGSHGIFCRPKNYSRAARQTDAVPVSPCDAGGGK